MQLNVVKTVWNSKKAMNELGIDMGKKRIANTVEEALAIGADKLGYPVVVRPAYTMGGARRRDLFIKFKN